MKAARLGRRARYMGSTWPHRGLRYSRAVRIEDPAEVAKFRAIDRCAAVSAHRVVLSSLFPRALMQRVVGSAEPGWDRAPSRHEPSTRGVHSTVGPALAATHAEALTRGTGRWPAKG